MGVSLNIKYANVLQGVLLLSYYYYSCYAASISLPAPMSKSPPSLLFSLKIPLLAHHSSLTRLRSFCWALFTAINRLLSYQVACLVYCTKDFFLGFVIISEPCWWLQCWSHSELTTISTNNPGFSSPPTNAASVCHSIQSLFFYSSSIITLHSIQLLSFSKYCIVLYNRYLIINIQNTFWVIHENRLAYVCPWTITTINHCDPTITCMSVIILKYISTQQLNPWWLTMAQDDIPGVRGAPGGPGGSRLPPAPKWVIKQ